MKIGFIGTGKITNSCVRSLTGKGHNIMITERNIDISSTLSDLFDDVVVGTCTIRSRRDRYRLPSFERKRH
jgi:pyrroline-5-carboxylate reductase